MALAQLTEDSGWYDMQRTILALTIVAFASVDSRADDWPMYGADAARSGYTSETLPDQLSRKWTYVAPHPPMPAWPTRNRLRFDAAYQPVVADGRLFSSCFTVRRSKLWTPPSAHATNRSCDIVDCIHLRRWACHPGGRREQHRLREREPPMFDRRMRKSGFPLGVSILLIALVSVADSAEVGPDARTSWRKWTCATESAPY
jgi:hypothetical protein